MFVEVKNFEALRAAMKQLCDFLEERDVPEDSVFDSKLVVSELVSNVLQHSDGTAFLEGEIRGNFIELKVRSTVRFCPPEESCCSAYMPKAAADCSSWTAYVPSAPIRRTGA